MKELIAADLFCGAGGASTALRAACDRLGRKLKLVAVNHWPTAIATHQANHPDAEHRCASVDLVSPTDLVPGRRLHLLLAGPECTQHSRARGGRPIHDQQRTPAWAIIRWLTELCVDRVLIENVEEFRDWAPLGTNGRPMPSKKGSTYQAFLDAIRALGYRVEDRVLNAADYGEHTSRRRLFIQAVRGRGAIHWPNPTHSRNGQPHLFGGAQRWRAARDIIDWSDLGRSIFRRPKPLSPKTMERIVAGGERFWSKEFQPYLVVMRQNASARSLDLPLPTITAGGTHFGLAHPFVVSQQSRGAPRSVERPLPTIAAAGAHALVQGVLVPFYGERPGQAPRPHGIDDPVPTLPASPKFGLATPFLTSYYGTGGVTPVTDPVPTITTRDRFGLVQPVIGDQALDILFRMLRPHELAAATGFPPTYRFAGTATDQVRQIGNAWPVRLGQALLETMLGETP